MSSAPSASPPRRAQLERWFEAGLRAVAPDRALADALTGEGGALGIAGEQLPGEAGLVGLAIGKAACAMADVLEQKAGSRLRRGLAITKAGHSLPLDRFQVLEASHPVPDARSAAAARAALSLAAGTAPDEILVVLLSGGASALTSLPCEGLSIGDLARVGEWLLACGADIEEMNCVRKHLGAFGGGRLALATPAARVYVLAISDVVGDRLDVIGSGPCTADPTSWGDALAVVRRRGGGGVLPESVLRVLEQGATDGRNETPSVDDSRFERVRTQIVARNADARVAMRHAARAEGWQVVDGGESLSGEARQAGAGLVAAARTALQGAERGLYLVGGETTVTLRGVGVGGRCQELALAAALAERGATDWALLAAGSDGGDGPTEAAGAHADGRTVERGKQMGQRGSAALAANDSHGFFAAEGGLLRTGPTHTNVMDLVLIAITAAGAEAAGE